MELCNDWEAIFQMLHQPQVPLTNDASGRALRHVVNARRLSHGTTRQSAHVSLLRWSESSKSAGNAVLRFGFTWSSPSRTVARIAPRAIVAAGGLNGYALNTVGRKPLLARAI